MPGPKPPSLNVRAHHPRRAHARLRLGIPATFISIGGKQQVRLTDLSQGGAHLMVQGDVKLREGMLQWMHFEVFAVAVWRQGDEIGLEFEKPISADVLLETRQFAPNVVRGESLDAQSAARDFVAGRRYNGTER